MQPRVASVNTAEEPDRATRRARVAVAALFLTNGGLISNIVPRYPEIKARLYMDDAVYGLSLAALPAGAIVAGIAAAVVIRRFGSAVTAVVGTILTSIGVLLAGLAPSILVFGLVLFVVGACDAITDVAQNAHGLRVQRIYGRSILNGFHAVWSVGAVLGGSMAAAALALGIPIGVHLAVSAVAFSTMSLVALRFCLPGSDEPQGGERSEKDAHDLTEGRVRRVWLPLAALVAIGVAGTVVEDLGNSWVAVYLSGPLNAPPVLAALGYIVLVGSQFVGRLMGDSLIDRFGQRAVARAGGFSIAAGMGLALAFPNIPLSILGFAAAGFGCATLVPGAMHAADELPGLKHGVGLTILSWLMRIGFLLSPPVVGFIAEATSLRIGLLVVPLAGLVVLLFAGVFRGRTPSGGMA